MCGGCRIDSSPKMDRRDFLRLGGAGLAGAMLLGTTGASRAFAQAGPSLRAEFEDAADEYGVPARLLVAMGYVNTRLRMPPPTANEYEKGDPHGWGSYGIMALVRNPSADTLGEASRLTRIPVERLKTDRAANIRGGAALLAEALGGGAPEGTSRLLDAVAGRGRAAGKNYAAVAGVGGGDLYAEQVRLAFEDGIPEKFASGGSLDPETRSLSEGDGLSTRVVRQKPPVEWHPAHSGNYTPANRPRSHRITTIVIHGTQGSWSSATNWFADPRASTSAHYVIRSRDGKIAQCVSDRNIAWHAGNWPVNQHSIGIEHEVFFNDPGYYTPEMYSSSARLVAYLCRTYRIPIDRRHIIGHNEASSTPCPGQYWWWRYYMRRVRRFAS